MSLLSAGREILASQPFSVLLGAELLDLGAGRAEIGVARARVMHEGHRQVLCRCEVFTSDDGIKTLCAVAQGTVRLLIGT